MFLALIVGLVEYSKEKPALVAATGSASGLFAWAVNWFDVLTRAFQIGAGFIGFVLALISLILALPRFCRFLRRAFNNGFLNADRE